MAINGLHTADNHLGFRQYGLQIREKDIMDSFARIVHMLVRDKDLHYMTVSGDLLNSKYPSVNTMTFLSKMHDVLRKAGKPCFVISGNHDGGYKSNNWIGIFNSGSLELDEGKMHQKIDEGGFIDIDGMSVEYKGVTIFGAPYMKREAWLELQSKLPKHDILLMHQTFKEFFNFNSANSFSFEDINKDLFGCTIVGDIHISKTVELEAQGKKAYLVSPGSTELLSKGEAATKYVVVSSKEDEHLKLSYVDIKTRDVITFDVGSIDQYKEIYKRIVDTYTDADEPLVYLNINIENVYSPNQLPDIGDLFHRTILRMSYGKQLFVDSEDEVQKETDENITVLDVGMQMFDRMITTSMSEFKNELSYILEEGLKDELNFRREVEGVLGKLKDAKVI